MTLRKAQRYAATTGKNTSARRAVLGLSPSAGTCSGFGIPPFADGPQLRSYVTPHFQFQYTAATMGAGLTVQDYARAFEASWDAEVRRDGWAPPPSRKPDSLEGRYPVVIDAFLAPGLYGYASATSIVGNNPATPWNEGDARSSCIVINGNFEGFGDDPKAALDATAAHEFFHALQFGLGVFDDQSPDSVFVEGLATWMEDEVFDDANDSYNYLWPETDQSMAEYFGNIYGYFVVFRGLTERLGLDGRRMIRDFHEIISRRQAQNVNALVAAVRNHGIEIGPAFHDTAIALAVTRPCRSGYALPHCFEEADGYRRGRGPLNPKGNVTRTKPYEGTIEDDLTMARIWLPPTGAPYTVTVRNGSPGGVLRVSVVCDTGKGLRITALPRLLTANTSAATPPIDPAGCALMRLVVTNESIAKGNPDRVAARAYSASLS